MMDVWDDGDTDTENKVCEYSAESADSANDSASDQVENGQSSTCPATSHSPRTSYSVTYNWQEVTAGM